MRDWFRSRGLVRPRSGRVVAGVCAGLARWLGVNAWLVRVALVLSFFLPGPQLVAYVVLWIMLPED